ncbi:hypothetical protein ASD67_19025 [Sphingopyxis sp. Root1497]|nr:hypothetical protein ASD67_19025 [Sphingopyxis sp. Root1497]
MGQAKAEKRFSADDIRKAADKFLFHWETHWHDKKVSRFILFVGCTIKNRKAGDEVIAQTNRFAAFGIDFLIWDSPAIYDHLPGAPAAVRTYLGQDWYERIFGKPAGPLSGLLRDIESGWDLSVLRVQSFVTRLNQAETAEIAELKRRARRGERSRVIAELENALHSEVAHALAPNVKAEKLRLLAGLIIDGDTYQRVRQLLDAADALDGESGRLRAILLMESVGAKAAIDNIAADAPAELAEVLAVAMLREGRPAEAFTALERFLGDDEPRAETLRLAALAKLLMGDRQAAVEIAERAQLRDPESRACQQSLGIVVFHRALSSAVAPETGEWPQPVDQPLVITSDTARADLERAEAIFRALAVSEELEGHPGMVMWHFGVLACMPWRHAEVLARLEALQKSGTMPTPLVAWALSRALPFDRQAAALQCDAELEADPANFETLLIRVALANANGEVALAREILDAKRDVLEQASHGSLYVYWSAVLDLECHCEPSEDALGAHPWLRLRRVLDVHSRKRRAKGIAQILDDQLGSNGDARVILAAAQLLLDAGWHKSAAKAAEFLIEHIGTAEAIAAAAFAYYRSRRPKDVLSALSRVDAFPESKLPVELDRLRAECLAATGSLLHARDASLVIARATGQPHDVWRSIHFQLAIGAAPKALALYEEHAEALSAPAPGHIALARAVLRSHPDAARRITKQFAAQASDDYVTAAFELANKLRMASEQRSLMARMQVLGNSGKGGVILITVEDVIRMISERRAQEERAFEQYANGHGPVYFVAGLRDAMLSTIYLEPLLDPPRPGELRPMLSARYGRRLEEDEWPENRGEVRLIADVTALLTAQGLGILDIVERAFAPLRLPPDAVTALTQIRAELDVAQPQRLDAAKSLLARRKDREVFAAADLPIASASKAVWKPEDATEPNMLSLARLMEVVRQSLGTAALEHARDQLGDILDSESVGPLPEKGSVVILEAGLAVSLEQAGLIDHLARRNRIGLEDLEFQALEAQVASAEKCQRQADTISDLIARLHSGLEDGTYQTVAYGNNTDADPLRRSFMQTVSALADDGGIAWVDDRFTTSIDNKQFQTATTVEIIDALVRYRRLNTRESDKLRQALRAARWSFMPQRGGEIERHLRAATRKGQVAETQDIALLRRAIGETLVNRRRLQWPNPSEAAKGAKGELPFLLDSGHAITEALVAIWRDDSWDIADAEVASEWILDTLEIGLFPQQALAAGDPRSDQLIGVHLGSLVLVAMQFYRGREMARQAAYLDWFWRYCLGNSYRSRPALRPAVEAMIAKHLERDGEEGPDERLWRVYLAKVVNAMPMPIRIPLLQRSELRQSFDLPEHGQISLDGEDYDELEFFSALIGADVNSVRRVVAASGKQAKIDLVIENGSEHVRLKIGRKTMRIDDWARRVSSDVEGIRAAAIDERRAVLDMSDAERLLLMAELGKEPDRIKRVRTVLSRSHETMQHEYNDFEQMVEARRPFGLSEFAPSDIGKVLRHIRLEKDMEQSATSLIEERGLAIAIRRFGALPIMAPDVLRSAFQSLSEDARTEVLDDAEIETAPPWTQLLAADLVLASGPSAAQILRIRNLIERAFASETASFWQLYIALADYTAFAGASDPQWSDLTSAQQLAISWSHANFLTEILAAGGVVISSLLELLRGNRLIPPRFLVEPINKFDNDTSDPRQMTPDRLRAHVAAPALFRLHEIPEHEEWTAALLRALVLQPGADGTPQPRMEIARRALAPDDALGSVVAASFGDAYEALYPGAKGLFRDGVQGLIETLLSDEADPDHRRASWQIVRMASGDTPLPRELSELVHAAAASGDVGFDSDDIEEARSALLIFAALAATNGWEDAGPRIDAEADRLGPRPEEEEVMILFEIAVWRARLATDPIERTRLLADRLRQLGKSPLLVKQAEVAARHFARGLSGHHSEAFVDTLGVLYAQR